MPTESEPGALMDQHLEQFLVKTHGMDLYGYDICIYIYICVCVCIMINDSSMAFLGRFSCIKSCMIMNHVNT